MPSTIRREILDKILSDISFPKDILDLGGKKDNKRGKFSYSDETNVIYLNIDQTTNPDLLSDITELPFKDNSINNIACFEVIEHLKTPEKSLEEINRVLKKNGKLYISMPFLVGIHADPSDYQRWTLYKLIEELEKIGFICQNAYHMGGIWAVIHDILHQYLVSNRTLWSRISYRVLNIFGYFIPRDFTENKRLDSVEKITTGYFLILEKK